MPTLVALFIVGLLHVSTANGDPQSKLVRIDLEKNCRPPEGRLRRMLASYLANVAVGTPPIAYQLAVDINSRETLLPQARSVSYVKSGLRFYAPDSYSKDDSSTGVEEQEGGTYEMEYKNTKLFGKVYTDRLEFLDVVGSPARAKLEQRFIAVTARTREELAVLNAEGVLAFSPQPVSLTGSVAVPINMARAGLITTAQFGLLLHETWGEKYGGELTLGGFDASRYQDELMFHELVNQNSWTVRLTSVQFGNETIAGNGGTALLSTNTNAIYAPTEAIKKVLRRFGHPDIETSYNPDYLYDVDCTLRNSEPSFTFTIDNSTYTLGPRNYIRELPGTWMGRHRLCYIALFSNESDDNKWELGTNFLSNFYAAFDIDQRRVALATKTSL